MPAMPQAIHAAAWMDPPDLPTLLPGRMTASKRASLVRFAELFSAGLSPKCHNGWRRILPVCGRRKPSASAVGAGGALRKCSSGDARTTMGSAGDERCPKLRLTLKWENYLCAYCSACESNGARRAAARSSADGARTFPTHHRQGRAHR